MNLPLPPKLPGVPLLGNFLQYRRDHVDVFWEGYRRFGPIFSLQLGPQRAVVLIGPENNRFFFSQVDRTLSVPEIYKFVIPMFGTVLNAEADQDTRLNQLALLHSAFKGEKMNAHLNIMFRETREWIDSLQKEGTFEVYEALTVLAMRIAARAFMGEEIRARLPEFLPLYQDLARGMDFVLPPNLPLPRFRRRDRARRKLNQLIQPILDHRRRNSCEYHDFLQVIVEGKYRGATDADETIIGLALLTVFTAYITTAAQACWALVEILRHPDYLAELRAEQEAILHGRMENLNLENVGRLEKLDWAVKEAQRLHPVMSHYARYNSQPYELNGYQIQQGWLTMLCPAVSHRLSHVFRDPHHFDPERFSPARAEDRKEPYGLIGFGGGVYRCPGAAFGTNEIKCILSLLFEQFQLELLDPEPRRAYDMGIIRPSPPCRVRYSERTSSEKSTTSSTFSLPSMVVQRSDSSCPINAANSHS